MRFLGVLVYIHVVFLNERIFSSCFAQTLHFLIDHLIMIIGRLLLPSFVPLTGPYLVLFHLDEPLNVL